MMFLLLEEVCKAIPKSPTTRRTCLTNITGINHSLSILFPKKGVWNHELSTNKSASQIICLTSWYMQNLQATFRNPNNVFQCLLSWVFLQRPLFPRITRFHWCVVVAFCHIFGMDHHYALICNDVRRLSDYLDSLHSVLCNTPDCIPHNHLIFRERAFCAYNSTHCCSR